MPIEKPKSYVYVVTNNINGKYYIGSHCGSNPKYMGSGVALQYAFKKYGRENFTKEVLHYCEDYQKQEGLLLVALDAAKDPKTYNLTNAGSGGSAGRPYAESTRKLMQHKHGGKRNPMYGVKQTPERIQKTIESNRRRVYSDETKKKLSDSARLNASKKYNCPHCSIKADRANLARWHGSNCKHRVQ